MEMSKYTGSSTKWLKVFLIFLKPYHEQVLYCNQWQIPWTVAELPQLKKKKTKPKAKPKNN